MLKTSPTQELSSALLACSSVTPDEGGCFDVIEKRLLPLGFQSERVDRHGVGNLWVRRGTARPLFVFAGHVDVVPTGPLDQWTSPPFSPTVREGFLYGRGAVDMKSSIAAAIVAVENLLAAKTNLEGSIAFLITADEEGDASDGTVAVIDKLEAAGEIFDYCIVGEPTSESRLGDMIKNGRRGSLSVTLKVKGIQCHIAYPEKGKNPIHQIAPVLAELSNTLWDEGNEFFPPTSWQVSNIHGGTGATNVIPGAVEIKGNFRFCTASTPASLQARFIEILNRHHLSYEIFWTLGSRPFLTEKGKLVEVASDVIEAICQQKPSVSTTGGTSDGRFIARICKELLEVGPVNATSHQIDECIALDDLPRLTAIYQGMIEKLLCRAP